LRAKGAYALVRLSFSGAFGALDLGWTLEASDAALSEAPSIDRYELENSDGLIAIIAPENTRDAAAIPPERLAMLRAAYRPLYERVFAGDLQWVGCHYRCPALARGVSVAKETTKSTEAYASFLASKRSRYRDGWLPTL
jgi:hypothetical protein